MLSSTGLLARSESADLAGRRRRPDQPRRRRLGGPDDGPRRDRGADLAGPAGQARRPRPLRGDAAPVGQPPQPQRVSADQRDALARVGRTRVRAVHAGHRRSRDRSRHPGRHRQAGQPRGHRQGRVGRHRAQGRRRGRRSGRSSTRAARRSASSPPTPSCCTSAPTASGRRAVPAAGWPAYAWLPGRRSPGSACFDSESSVVVTASGSTTALPGTEPGAVKVTPFGEYPARAARPVACAATGSSRARTPWSSPGRATRRPGPRPPAAHPSTCPRPTAGDGSGTPGAQPIAAAAGPVGARLARFASPTLGTVCEAGPVKQRARHGPRRSGWSRRPCCSVRGAAAALRVSDDSGKDDAEAEEALAAAKATLRRDLRGPRSRSSTDDCRAVSRASPRPPAPARTRRRSRAPSSSASTVCPPTPT